jgi:hypothetical protein
MCCDVHYIKVYQDEKEVAAMMDLRLAYEGNDLDKFERTLKVTHLPYTTSNTLLSHQQPSVADSCVRYAGQKYLFY